MSPGRRTASRAALALACVVSLVAGCGRSGERSGAAAQDPQRRAQELIDSGNSAYRAGNFALAARRYAAAATVKKDDPAAYFGMGMALSKLGRDEEARRAYAKARDLAQAQSRAADPPSPPKGP